MKRNSLILITLFAATIVGAQTINLHMNNGMVVNYNSSEVDYIDFSESSSGPVSNISCPDGNHPHLIDLGLPSGTKWACCNVGANSPEQYGGYYAWGETVEKSSYDWSNYILCDGTESTCHYIGSDIAGTNYDMALVKWRESWVMPSYSQFEELIENCTTEWTTLNGINGYTFTGPNGSSIFLPASGYYGFSDKFFEGSVGLFWSSTYNKSNKDQACYLRFDSGRLTLDYYLNRNSGQPVRAVQKGTSMPVAGFSADYKNAVGQYTGTMYALDFANSQAVDTLAHPVNAVISADSLITFSDFPLHFIAKEISDVKLREAVEAKGSATLKVKYAIYSKSDSYIYIYIAPQTVYVNGVAYNSGSHEVAFSFIYPSQGFFITGQYIQIPMYLGGIYLDNVLREDLTQKSAAHQILQFQGNRN